MQLLTLWNASPNEQLQSTLDRVLPALPFRSPAVKGQLSLREIS